MRNVVERLRGFFRAYKERQEAHRKAQDEVRICDLTFSKERGMEFSAKHPAFALLAEELARCFTESGGENYVEVTCYHEKTGPLVLTMQRRHGKTPGQVNEELKAEIAELNRAMRVSVPVREKQQNVESKGGDA